MRRHYTPRPYGALITSHILEHARCNIWAGMGMGKTSSALAALATLDLTYPGPALVLAPKLVAQSTWPDEAAKWDHLAGTVVAPVVGTAAQRAEALRREANVYTTNYENIPWLIEHLGGKWPFAKVVADEATRLKGFRLRQGGKRAQALAKVAFRSRHFALLTGTPSPNGLLDLWGQAWFLDRGEALGKSFRAFTDRWFQAVRVGADPHAVRYDPLPHSFDEIVARLRPYTLALDARDWFDLREPIVNTLRVELPAKARRIYRQLEQELLATLPSGAEVEAIAAADRNCKLLQVANGALYTEGGGGSWEEVHDAKILALESVVEEAAGAPVLVAYHFRHDLARLLRAFPQGRELDANPQTIRDWNAGRIPVLFAHPDRAGHGLNLQDGGNILAVFGHWYALEAFLQILERIGPTRQAQAGHDRPVFVYHIVAAGTVDERVVATRDGKRAAQAALLDALVVDSVQTS